MIENQPAIHFNGCWVCALAPKMAPFACVHPAVECVGDVARVKFGRAEELPDDCPAKVAADQRGP